MKSKLQPTPITTPAVKNSPPTFLVANPLKISPVPSKPTPINAVLLAPNHLITLALTSASILTLAEVKLPTKLIVLGLLNFLSTRAA
jgi:hypothetical protein